MERKEKIKIVLLTVSSALAEAVALLNEDGQLEGTLVLVHPEEFAPQILKSLRTELADIEALEPYKDLSAEQLIEKQEQERIAALEKMQADAAEKLKKLKEQQRPVDVLKQPEGDQDDDDDDDFEGGLNGLNLDQVVFDDLVDDDQDPDDGQAPDSEGTDDAGEVIDGQEGETVGEPGEGTQIVAPVVTEVLPPVATAPKRTAKVKTTE